MIVKVRNSRREIGNAVPNQNALEIDCRATFGGSDVVLVNDLAGEDGEVSPLTNKISHCEFAGGRPAYGVGFSGEMESPPRELGEGLEENSNECLDVLCSFFSGLYNFPVIRVRETNSDATVLLSTGDSDTMGRKPCDVRLVQEENVGFIVPAVRVPGSPVRREVTHIDIAWSKLHEKTHRARAPRTWLGFNDTNTNPGMKWLHLR